MKSLTKAVIVALAGAMTLAVSAQNAPGPEGAPAHDGPPSGDHGPAGRHHRPPSPLVAALDANHDGVIDASELAAAAAVLKKLDINGDGKLTHDEIAPRPPKHDGQAPDGQNPPPPHDGADKGGPGGPGKGPAGHRPADPVMKALDVNGDGVIDADEIANATKALLTLDKNSDGKLTPDEFAPPRPEKGAGPGAERKDRRPQGE